MCRCSGGSPSRPRTPVTSTRRAGRSPACPLRRHLLAGRYTWSGRCLPSLRSTSPCKYAGIPKTCPAAGRQCSDLLVADEREGGEPRFGGVDGGVSEVVCKLDGSAFHNFDDMFDGVLLAACSVFDAASGGGRPRATTAHRRRETRRRRGRVPRGTVRKTPARTGSKA